MPYTLTKGLLWFALALLLGIVIGWLLRSIRATRQVRAARHARHDAAEVERLRARVAELAGARSAAGDDNTVVVPAPEATDRPGSPPPADATDTGAEAAIDARVPTDAVPTEPAEVAAPGVPAEPVAEPVDPLTSVVGIDAGIARLCHNIGIHTLDELAITEVSLLRTMLADAGPPFDAASPDTWPQQAALLAAGDHDGLRALLGDDSGGATE